MQLSTLPKNTKEFTYQPTAAPLANVDQVGSTLAENLLNVAYRLNRGELSRTQCLQEIQLLELSLTHAKQNLSVGGVQ